MKELHLRRFAIPMYNDLVQAEARPWDVQMQFLHQDRSQFLLKRARSRGFSLALCRATSAPAAPALRLALLSLSFAMAQLLSLTVSGFASWPPVLRLQQPARFVTPLRIHSPADRLQTQATYPVSFHTSCRPAPCGRPEPHVRCELARGRADQLHVRDRDPALLLRDAPLHLALRVRRTCFFTIITCSTRIFRSAGTREAPGLACPCRAR